MKKVLFFCMVTVLSYNVHSQATKFYSVAGEVNFSSAKIISESGVEGGDVMRFAPWFNIQSLYNVDYKDHGYFWGFTIRNIGFIYENGNEKWKARTYNVGIPIGLKWGNTNGNFAYVGYEFEMPIHYKEKYFLGEDKEGKNEVWFSDRVSQFTHSGFIGYNFKGGFNLKFKYYFTEFFNKDFDNSGITDSKDLRYPGRGTEGDADYIAPREYLKVNIFYLALTWNMFTKPYYYTHYDSKKEMD